MADALGFQKSNIVKNLVRLGLTVPRDESRKPWTEAERQLLREHWPDVVAKKVLARDLVSKFTGRTLTMLYWQSGKLGLSAEGWERPDNWIEVLKEKLALGWNDSEIAKIFGISRKYLCEVRNGLGLKASGHSDHYRKKVAAKTREQLAKAGLKSLAEVRGQRLQQFAESYGWPSNLRVRAVQILELLIAEPSLGRRAICEKLGLRWASCRSNGLYSNEVGGGGSYLTNLMKRGLVVKSPRVGPGYTASCYYSASPLALQMKADFLRKKDGTQNDGPSNDAEQHRDDEQPTGGQAAAIDSEPVDRRKTRGRRRQPACQS
jgi:hypothetical protein